MGIGLFKKSYTVRKYAPQTIKDGYASAEFTDITAKLNVQPLTPNELLTVPEGERTVKRVKSFGGDMLTSANESSGIPGDRLYYKGAWYECVSCVDWDHTLLKHYESQFVLLPPKEQEPAPQEVTYHDAKHIKR